MTEIKAIQTWYGGCYFRSRLEARWAVFFDALGIRWEHESEGYETPAGRYLPDLWLPDLRTRLEIKGEEPADDDLVRASYVADDAFKSGENFRVLIGGIPREPSTRTGPSCIPALTWMGPFSKDAPNAPWDIARGMAVANDQGFFGFLPSFWAFNRATLQPALTAARSARFEFGESGALRLHPTVKKPAGSPPVKPAGQLPLFGYDPDAKPYKYCPLHPKSLVSADRGL